MTLLVTDPDLRDRLIAERQATGADHHDEVWEGEYVMSPLANDAHQELVGKLTTVLELTVGMPGLGDVRPGVNLSDRAGDWRQNYRVPDLAVRLKQSTCIIRDTHWQGGPDFLVEILSEGDRARLKLPFYAVIGTREVLVIDCDPWALELYRLEHGQLLPVGVSRPDEGQTITSAVVPLTFRLVADSSAQRPRIDLAHPASGQRWFL